MTSAAADVDLIDFLEEPDPAEPVVVATLAEGQVVAGLEVSRRAITWGSMDGSGTLETPGVAALAEPGGPWISARAYTPDLGKSPLTLGGTITPLIPDALYEVSTDAWVVGFDPFTSAMATPSAEDLALLPSPYTLRVKNMSTHVIWELELPAVFHPDAGSLAVWGNTAMVGPFLVNLVTGEIFDVVYDDVAEPVQCFDSYGGVLADGVLLLHDGCEGGVVAVDVPASGITATALASSHPVIAGGEIEYLAASRGLVVWHERDPLGESLAVRWKRITDPADSYSEFDFGGGELDVEGVQVVGLRVQGERFVALLAVEMSPGLYVVGAVVFEAETGEAGPVWGELIDIWEPPTTERLGLGGVTADPSSDMNLAYLPVDLYGRTLAWASHIQGQVLAVTLPPLPEDLTAIGGPESGNPGKTVTLSGTGFQPGEQVAAWLTSTPVLLGLGVAAADGTFAGTFTLPAGTVAGAHTLTLVGVESGWDAERAIRIAALNTGLEVRTGR